MSAPGTPKASQAATTAVQEALDAHQRTEVMDGERFGGGLLNARIVIRCTCGESWSLDHVAVAAADAAAPHNAAQTLRDAGASVMGKHDEDAERGITTRPTWARVAAWLSARAGRIEADA